MNLSEQRILATQLQKSLDGIATVEQNIVLHTTDKTKTDAALVDVGILVDAEIIYAYCFRRDAESDTDFNDRVASTSRIVSEHGKIFKAYNTNFKLSNDEISDIVRDIIKSNSANTPNVTVESKTQEVKPFSLTKFVITVFVIGFALSQGANKVKTYFAQPDQEQEAEEKNASGVLLPDHNDEKIKIDAPQAVTAERIKESKTKQCDQAPPLNGRMVIKSNNIKTPDNSYWTFFNKTNLHGYVWLSFESTIISEFYIAPNQKVTFKAPPVNFKYSATMTEVWCSPTHMNENSTYQLNRTTESSLPSDYGSNRHAVTYIEMPKFSVSSSTRIEKLEPTND